jgi:hypothetical protein
MKSQHSTRRSILAGVSAMPVVAITGAAATAPSGDERRLFAIEAKVRELYAQADQVWLGGEDDDQAVFDQFYSSG